MDFDWLVHRVEYLNHANEQILLPDPRLAEISCSRDHCLPPDPPDTHSNPPGIKYFNFLNLIHNNDNEEWRGD